jgi:hypothetical protein
MEISEEHHMAEKTGSTLSDLIIYLLDKRRKSDMYILIPFLLIPSVALGLAACSSWFLWSPTIESSPGVISIKPNFFSKKISTFLIHPRGWQDTGITVSRGDKLTVRATGEINIGPDIPAIYDNALQVEKIIERSNKNLPEGPPPKFKYQYETGWPWSGPEGISDEQVEKMHKYPRGHSKDGSLMTNNMELGRLIGFVTDKDDFLLKLYEENEKLIATRLRETKNKSKLSKCDFSQLYKDFKLDKEHIVDFGKNKVSGSKRTDGTIKIPDSMEINNDSHLYLAVNDSTCPEWQQDNFGEFMVTIVK